MARRSGGSLAARHRRVIRVIARRHPPDIASEIVMALGSRPQWRVEVWAKRAGDKRKHRRVGTGRFLSHEVTLCPEKIGQTVNRPSAECDDLGARMSAHSM